MSNEELVIQIQSGRRELMAELWEQVRRFVSMQARRVPIEDRGDVELEDLVQSGFLAVAAAVDSYDPAADCTFLTHLGFYLKTEFAIATHFRSARQQRETLARPISLNTPLTDDPQDGALIDLLEDPSGVAALENAEERIYQAQLRKALERALDTSVTSQQGEILRARYFQNSTCTQVAEVLGCTDSNVGEQEHKALQKLYSSRYLNGLNDFVESNSNFHLHIGVQTFQRTGSSAVEMLVMRREKLAEQWLKRHRRNSKC